MQKIAYTILWSAAWGSGILKKVVGQVGRWIDAGYQPHIFMVSYQEDVVEQVRRMDPRIALTVRRCRSMPDRFVQYQRLLPLVRAWHPDMIYHRFAGYYPALASLARRYPMVFEINTDDVHEYALGPRYRYWYHLLTRGRLLGRGRGMVYVSEDFPRLPHYACFGKPGIVIGNGVDVAQYRPLPPAANERPHLVFIGSGSASQLWQGFDKVLQLAKLCPDWQFDVVGSGTSSLEQPPPPNLRMHGFLERQDYEPIFAQADVALGTLALYRKHIDTTSALKIGEYIAYGLPMILGYKDTNIPDPLPPYVLQIPNTPDNVQTHLDDIRRFVEQIRGTRVPRDQVTHVDAREKERERLAFFRRVVEP